MQSFLPLLDHVAPAMLVMFRIGGLLVFAPLFASSVIPVRVRVFLTIIAGLAVYPMLWQRGLQFTDGTLPLELWMLAPLIAMELALGMVIGFMATLPLVGIQIGGLVMGQQMGLGFARFFNPAIGDEADILGQLLFFAALAGFLLIDGHEALFLAILHSFDHVPLGGFEVDGGVVTMLVGTLAAATELALRISAPLLALIFLETVAMGFIAKTVPQLNILSLGFPVRILVGLGVIAIGLTIIDEVMMDEMDRVLNLIFTWIEYGAGAGDALNA